MEKGLPNIELLSASQILQAVPLVQGAIAGQSAINQRMEELKEEAKVQGEEVFAPLYNRISNIRE
jgi:hypothetical protein